MSKNKTNTREQLYEVWGDIITVKPLLISITLATLMGLVFFVLAPDNESLQLIIGISGIVLATIINSFLFKPKRDIQLKAVEKTVNSGQEDN